VDAELTDEEMGGVTRHLAVCPSCARECQSLQQTKALVASLALKAPRAELAALLLTEAEHTRNAGPLARFFPGLVGVWNDGYVPQAVRAAGRLRPLTATVMLSVAGLWLASTQVDGPTDLPVLAVAPTYEPMSAMSVPHMVAARSLSFPPALLGVAPVSPFTIGSASNGPVFQARFSVTVTRWHGTDSSVVSVASVPSRAACVVSQVLPAQNAVQWAAPVREETVHRKVVPVAAIVPASSNAVRYSVPVSAYPPVPALPASPPVYRVYGTGQWGYNTGRSYPSTAYSVYSPSTAH
jgi:hypothetical protein